MAGASRDAAPVLRVGDVAARTGTTSRMVRYYENQGLITAARSLSGQRLFAPAVVDQVRHIRMLLAAGLPTRAISDLLDCIRDPDRLEPCAVPLLVEHLREYDSQIADLVNTRDALQGLIDTTATRRH